MKTKIPKDFPVKPLKKNEIVDGIATCGTCGQSWDDLLITSMTPAPSGRCPFEAFHDYEETTKPQQHTSNCENDVRTYCICGADEANQEKIRVLVKLLEKASEFCHEKAPDEIAFNEPLGDEIDEAIKQAKGK